VGRDDQPDAREGQAGRPGEAERFIVLMKPGNAYCATIWMRLARQSG
jgi:hypothetical protein